LLTTSAKAMLSPLMEHNRDKTVILIEGRIFICWINSILAVSKANNPTVLSILSIIYALFEIAGSGDR
jgi:hypothetical protein